VDAPPRRAEVPRRLDLILVQALDRIVEREDHHQEVGIGQADIEAGVAAQEIDRRIDQAETHHGLIDQPF
jgi:hypothetical protein